MTTTTKGRKGGAASGAAPLADGSGEWSAGLRHDGQAALVGAILAAMPHLDELIADLVADRLGGDARPVLAALDEDDAARMALLENLPGGNAALAAAIADYATTRRLWRAYGGGLWYTHRSGRTYLAAPETGGAAFRVAREVKPADLLRAREQADRLAASLAALVDAPARRGVRRKPQGNRSQTMPHEAAPADKPATRPAPGTGPEPADLNTRSGSPPADAPARAKRLAPSRTTGARRRRAPVRPATNKAADTTSPPSGDDVPVAAE